jgi:rhodanese-related sulfurtransferase
MASFAPCICLLANEGNSTSVEDSRHVVTISLQQAKRLHELGATFIDIRSADDWRIGHIDKALHYDFYQDLSALKDSTEFSKDTPLVFYCESSECLQAAYASAVSLFWGYDKVFYFQDGYFAWLLNDYPIQSLVSNLH